MLNLLSTLVLTLPLTAGAPQDVASVVAANNQFAFDLYNQLRGQDGNLFFSPYSINKTLAMTYAGARGDTAAEMAAVLHFTLGQDRQHRAFLETRNLLNRNLGAGTTGLGNLFRSKRGVQLLLSANLWGQPGYGFQKNFLALLQECYGAGLQEVDFAAPEQARQTINAWVEKQTNRKIQELFQPNTINSATRLVLASAIYFKGDWVQPFQKQQTHTETFSTSGGGKVQVPLMNQTDTFGYFEDEQLQGLQMSYEGKGLALVVLLPRKAEGLADLEKTLTAARLASWISQLSEQPVDVSLPKFKLTSEFSLGGSLAALGMKKAFDPSAADFGSMNGGREPLYIGMVIHKAFVDVNEEGTEAAAATAVAVLPGLSLPNRPAGPVFRANHPFVFAIRDVRTGMILFLGRVVKP